MLSFPFSYVPFPSFIALALLFPFLSCLMNEVQMSPIINAMCIFAFVLKQLFNCGNVQNFSGDNFEVPSLLARQPPPHLSAPLSIYFLFALQLHFRAAQSLNYI